jgi:hypothetical protein
MTWNHDITSAPLDRRLWLATKCEKVSVTRWNEKRGAWDGLATGEQPIAWQEYVVPVHPNHQSDVGAIAAVKGNARLANVTDVEPHASDLITHKHVFLDDVGSGA